MPSINDPRLDDILATGTCTSLPADVCAAAYRVTRLLLAATTWGDVQLFRRRLAHLEDGRHAIGVTGKWVLIFTWYPGSGARDLALQRV